MEVIQGFHAIEEYLRSGKAKGCLAHAKLGPRAKAIAELASGMGIGLKPMDEAEFKRLYPEARGIVMLAESTVEADGWDLEGLLNGLAAKERALVLILDHISDPHNLGAILRCADQFGVDAVFYPQDRAARETQVVRASSAGASAWVPWLSVPNLARVAGLLKEGGFWIYEASMEGQAIWEQRLAKKAVLVMGAEGQGVTRLLSKLADESLAIPRFGRLDSLNVSVAAGVMLYELRRQWEAQ